MKLGDYVALVYLRIHLDTVMSSLPWITLTKNYLNNYLNKFWLLYI